MAARGCSYYSAAPAYRELPDWLQRTVLKEVVKRRFEDANVSPLVVASLLKPIAAEDSACSAATPKARCARPGRTDRVRAIGIPVAFMFLLFLIVVMTTPQLLNACWKRR